MSETGDHQTENHKYEQKYRHYCLTHIMVSKGDWLWKPANIKVENNGSVVYVRSSLNVHNPFFWGGGVEGKYGELVRALVFHHCGLGSNRELKSMWVEFVVGSLPCSERFFSGWSGFPISLTLQLFQISIGSWRHGPVSTSSLELLSAPWVNKLHAFF